MAKTTYYDLAGGLATYNSRKNKNRVLCRYRLRTAPMATNRCTRQMESSIATERTGVRLSATWVQCAVSGDRQLVAIPVPVGAVPVTGFPLFPSRRNRTRLGMDCRLARLDPVYFESTG